MQSETFLYTSEEDALDLHVYAWTPNAAPRAIVQIAHGMAEHAGRYARFAEALTDAGFAVYAHDHRGHGKSILAGQPVGHMGADGFRRAAFDVHTLGLSLEKKHPGLKRVLFGHSMGSFYVQRVIYEFPTSMHAAVMSGSNGKPPAIAALGRGITRAERFRVGASGVSPLIQKLSFGDFNNAFKPNRTEFDWLSRDPAEVDKYVADPLCGFAISVQSWIDLLDALGSLTKPNNLRRARRDLPLYVFAGDDDPVSDRGEGVRRLVESYRTAGLSRLELKLYPDARHETLNETNRDEVTQDVITWIEGTL